MRFKERPTEEKKRQGILDRVSDRIYESRWYRRLFLNRGMLADYLKLLHPGKRIELLLADHHRKKIREFLMGMALAVILLLAGVLWSFGQEKDREADWAQRPDYDAGDRQECWEVVREDGTKEEIRLNISERAYTREEAADYLEKGAAYLDDCILGENESADRVEYPLIFPEYIEEGNLSIQWFSGQPEILSSGGQISEDYMNENGTIIEVKAVLRCMSEEASYIRSFRVYPAKRDEKTMFYSRVLAELRKTELETREKEGFELPKEVDGEKILFQRKAGKELFFLAGLCLLAFVLLYGSRDEKISREIEKRSKQLLADYPELVSKLTVLLRAGLTVRTAFGKITADYRKQKEREGYGRYAYEELAIAYYEMTNGVPEDRACEGFGKRCGLLPYMRLGGLLAQNVRRGNKNLLEVLNQEAQEAFEERKRRARKAGEEAGTKMLVPMVLMLLVTILIVLYPAFSSFQI